MGKASKIIGLLKKHGGRVLVRCGQDDEPMRSVLQLHKGAAGGICRTLVMKWMCERSHGRNFWDWLMPGGKLNMAAVANITIQQIDVGKTHLTPTTAEDTLGRLAKYGGPAEGRGGAMADRMQYLRFYGDLGVSEQLFTKGKARHYVASGEGRVPELIGQVVCDEAPPERAFLFVGMASGTDGHALGIDALGGGGGVGYYDPNLGEIAFASAAGFASWMKAISGEVYAAFTNLNYEWLNRMG